MSNKIDVNELKNALRILINDAEKDHETHKLITDLVAVGLSSMDKSIQSTNKRSKASQPSINPFEIFRISGAEGLKEELSNSDHNILLNIIKYYGLDPSRKSYRWRNKDNLVKLIFDRVCDMSVQGDVFSR